ncbi:MAG TPA: beta/gamma crystallin-related protein [Candidatus Angelobacter sp.]|nr:beta/gamma crystallin-related protein [Candidatus Angelobacter sp.]
MTGIGDTVALPVQTTSTAKVQIFADTNFKGKVLTLTDATPDLRTYYFNDTVSSVKVISGTWTFYPHINYESTGSFTPFTLKPGDYATLPGGTNDEISSLKPA